MGLKNKSSQFSERPSWFSDDDSHLSILYDDLFEKDASVLIGETLMYDFNFWISFISISSIAFKSYMVVIIPLLSI